MHRNEAPGLHRGWNLVALLVAALLALLIVARGGGNWTPLWSVPLPAGFVFQNTISFNFPQVGLVPVISRLMTPAGPACTSAIAVNTGP